MDVYKLIFGLLTLEMVKVDGAVSSPKDIEGCVGEDITIPWSYDDLDSDITSVLWSVDGSPIMTYFGGGGSRNPQGGYNVVAANNEGSINITNAQTSNTGTYKIEISALGPSSDIVDLLVCKPASTSLNGSKGLDSVMQCNASDLGEPEAQLYIKVNGEAKSSSNATVVDGDKVECCISGCAANCIGSGSEYCKTVQNCICECECECEITEIFSVVFGIPGALGLLIIIVGLLAGWCNGRRTLLLACAVVCFVCAALSLTLSAVVKGKECCEDCKDLECCEDSECCEDWVEHSATAFIVIPSLFGLASLGVFSLVWFNIIGPGDDGGNGFFCFNNGNDDGNDGGNDSGNNGHHRGRGTNSSTVHTERTDTHRGTLSDRANSDGEVSRKDVHVQENRDNFSGRPMPPIPPLTDKKGRGLSANYDDDHPMTSVGIPDKKAGQLVPLKEQKEQKKKEESKKRRKRKKKAVSDDDDDDDDDVV